MASRVNTKFVIILIVGVVAMLGGLLLAWNVAYKSPAELERRGDAFMAQGAYEQAVLAYSKAVNKNATNPQYLTKWVEALEHTIPATETTYTDRYFGDYLGAIKKTATILRRDIDAHERFLKLRHEMLMASYSRPLADRIIEETGSVLAFFDDGGAQQAQPWERLKRYRGLAITEIAKKGGVLSDDQFALAEDDLSRSTQVSPTDTEAIVGLMNLRTLNVNRTAPDHDTEARVRILKDNLSLVEDYLAEHPQSVEMMIQRILLSADVSRRELAASLQGLEQLSAMQEMFQSFRPELSTISGLLLGEARAQLDIDTLTLYSVLESVIDPEAQLEKTRRMIDVYYESNRDDAKLLWIAGRVAREAGDLQEAMGWYAQIGELTPKALSYQGVRQFEYQRRALLSQAEIKIEEAQRAVQDGAQDRIDRAMQEALEYRSRFASVVAEDHLSMIMLDGKIAQVQGDLAEALRLFKKYNEQTQRLDPEGLWYEGMIASQLGQLGVAMDALGLVTQLDTSRRRILSLLTLAQINTRLQNYETAAQLYKDVLTISPTLQAAIDGLEAVNKLLNPELNEDPVVAAIYKSRQMRIGDEGAPGDYAGAIQYLRDQVAAHAYDSRIARELASLLLDSNDVEGARQVIGQSIANNPDDEALRTMLAAMNSSDTTDILVEMIRQSDRPEIDKLLSIAQVATDRGRDELLTQTVARLNEIAPDDKRVLEMSFINAIKRGDLDRARQISARPDLSAVEKLSFQARIAATENNGARAIELLQQAAASGTADASVYQMLAILQRESGRFTDAIQSFEQALAIRPDNQQAITEYVLTLVRAGQFEQGLNTARRLQRHGSSNPLFMNLWLNLESLYGGEEGRDFAIRQRERMLELNPTNIDNKFQLARMYITTKQWDAARMLIDQLRAENDRLPFVELDATWYAERGTVDNRNGLTIANEVFAKYIASLPAPVGAEPYVANAEFMLSRGRPDLAVVAANEAVKRQTPDTMLGSRLLGDLYMRINNFSEAIKPYKDVIAAGIDADGSIKTRLIETYVRLERFSEAQEVYNQLPEDMRSEMITMLQGADIAVGLGEKARAGELLDRAVALFPNDPLVYVKRAEIMVGDESLLNDMLSDLGRAISLDPNSWRAHRVRAAGFFAVGREEDALKDLQTAVRLNPNLDRSLYAALNELLTQQGRASEAMDLAREVASRRPDDANLFARLGGLFASYKLWNSASEMYGLAWEKRHGINDGAMYIDALVRMTPPNADKAHEVINALAEMVGNINETPGLLAAQALVLQARGHDDFALQQITKAFDLSSKSDSELLNWSSNLSRFFEDKSAREQIQYLETLKRRNTNAEIQDWLDLFIARRLMLESQVPDNAYQIVRRLETAGASDAIKLRAFRLHGSTLFAQDRFQEAADLWKTGVAQFSDDWELNNNLAYVLSAKLGQPEEALSYGQTSLDQNIARSEAYETMAGIYIKLGKHDEAEQMIRTGSNYLQSIPARVTMLITHGRLELARGHEVEARSKLNDAGAVLRAAPESYPDLEEDIEAFAQEINTGQG